MPLKKKQNLLYFILSLSLFVSLYFQENSSGGSKLDNILTKHFIDYFQIGLAEGLNYFIKSGQVHSPVFYIIVAKTKLLFGNHLSSIIYVIISATLPFLFYNLLKKKFVHANKEYLFFLSLLIFLSPYFRSSASWFTNDNLAIILFCLSLKYFLKIKNNKDGKLNLIGTGKPLRQFMYAEDLALIIKLVISNNICESFNVAPNYNYSINEMVKIALDITNKNYEIIYSNPELDGQYRKDVSNSKLMKIFPSFKFTDFKVGLKKVYDKIS